MDYFRKGSSSFLKAVCEHCGNKTVQEIVTQEVSTDRTCTFTFSRCTTCDGLSLRRHPDDWAGPAKHGEKPLGENIHYEQLWPPALTLPPEAPDRIRKIYEEARAIKRHSPSSFVVQIRRALEAVANDKGAEGKTLMAKTEWLIKQGYLPEVFGEMSHISRMIGNLGAHDVEQDVTEDNVEVVDEFFRAIIEYLYVATAKVAHVKQLIGKK